MEFNTDLTEVVARYVGRRAVVQVYGHQRYIGTVAIVSHDFLLLTNGIQSGELDGGQWQDQLTMSNLDDGVSIGAKETLIRLCHVTSITCDDEELAPFESAEKPEQVSDESSADVVQQGMANENDLITIRIGTQLIPLATGSNGNGLPKRIKRLRTDFSKTFGFYFPPVRLRSTIDLDPNEYEFLVGGVVVGSGTLHPNQHLAINPGEEAVELSGTATIEPAFGLPATWIESAQVENGKNAGYTVVDSATVFVTHLGETLSRLRHELLTYDMLVTSLGELRLTSPALVKDHFNSAASKQLLYRVLTELLMEKVWIGDLQKISMSVAMRMSERKSFDDLVSLVRIDIARQILRNIVDDHGKVPAIIFDRELYVRLSDLSLFSNLVDFAQFADLLKTAAEAAAVANQAIAIVVPANKRKEIAHYLKRIVTTAPVISDAEMPADYLLDVRTVISNRDVVGEKLSDEQPGVGSLIGSSDNHAVPKDSISDIREIPR